MSFVRINRDQLQIISAVTFGNVLEWFEIYVFIYWAPILSKVFFKSDEHLFNLISILVIFGIGCIARPLGAIFFGHLGDRVGRKKSFILSIVVMTIPTFLMGMLPTYEQIGIYAPILLCLLRFLQSFPAGGESPGAFCYLYENADPTNQKFMTSWGGFGNQLGAILSVGETILTETYLSHEFLVSWGWRISFFTGGCIGLFGLYLRYMLHETPLFLKLREQHRISKETAFDLLVQYKKKIAKGVAYGAVNAATFYLIVSYIPNHFCKELGMSEFENIYVSLGVLVLTTLLLPVCGLIGDRLNCRSILLSSTLLIMLLLIPFSFFITNSYCYGIIWVWALYVIPVTFISALVPYLLTDLFPTPVRFMCVGVSFNLADGMIGGFTPAIVLALTQMRGNETDFCWFILACSMISLWAYYKIQK